MPGSSGWHKPGPRNGNVVEGTNSSLQQHPAARVTTSIPASLTWEVRNTMPNFLPHETAQPFSLAALLRASKVGNSLQGFPVRQQANLLHSLALASTQHIIDCGLELPATDSNNV